MFWETGPSLPLEQQRILESLDFERDKDAWRLATEGIDGLSAFRFAADVMLEILLEAWQIEPGQTVG